MGDYRQVIAFPCSLGILKKHVQWNCSILDYGLCENQSNSKLTSSSLLLLLSIESFLLPAIGKHLTCDILCCVCSAALGIYFRVCPDSNPDGTVSSISEK